MRILKLFGTAALAFFALMTAGLAGANDLAGAWIVRWKDDPKNENAITLTVIGGRLSGTYTNDAKVTCKVTGNIDEKTRESALTIVCPEWDVRMQGIASTTWNRLSGDYQAYVNDKGNFVMRKN